MARPARRRALKNGQEGCQRDHYTLRCHAASIGEYDLAFHRTRRQKFERFSRFKKQERVVNQRIDLLFREEREDIGQILAQWPGVPAVQRRDAVELAQSSA